MEVCTSVDDNSNDNNDNNDANSFYAFFALRVTTVVYNWLAASFGLVGMIDQVRVIWSRRLTFGISTLNLWMIALQSAITIVYGVGIIDSSQWVPSVVAVLLAVILIVSKLYIEKKVPPSQQAVLVHSAAIHRLRSEPAVRNALSNNESGSNNAEHTLGRQMSIITGGRSDGSVPGGVRHQGTTVTLTCNDVECHLVDEEGRVISHCNTNDAVGMI